MCSILKLLENVAYIDDFIRCLLHFNKLYLKKITMQHKKWFALTCIHLYLVAKHIYVRKWTKNAQNLQFENQGLGLGMEIKF
jgi:hypothetical protein